MKIFLTSLFLFSVLLLNIPAAPAGEQWVRIRSIIDGDTILLQDGRFVRFIGVNAPEIAHADIPAEPFGNSAKETLIQRLRHKKVRLELDPDHLDAYGRTLAHVFDQDNHLLSEVMIKLGLAHLLFHKKNQRYFDRLLQCQQEAMAQNKGIWKILELSEDEDKTYFIGSKSSKRVHRSTCRYAQKILRHNRKRFSSAWKAFEQGYAPAKGCLNGINAFVRSSEDDGTK